MNYEKSPKDHEILSADDERLGEMCRALKKVEAPKDFDFQLKARLANARTSDFQPRFGFAFRYALPALGLIMIVGLLAYSGGFFSSSNNPVVVQNSNPAPNPALQPNNALAAVTPNEANLPNENNENAVAVPATPNLRKASDRELAFRKARTPQRDPAPETRNGGSSNSSDQAFRETPLIQPSVLVPKNVLQTSPENENANPIPVKEVLSIMGIDAALENGKWKVRSLTANGVGESSGVKADDVIETIDDQPLSDKTVFNQTVKGATLTVTRNGVKSQIRLRNKQ